MTHPFCGRDEGKERPQQGIMAISTARIEHLARRVANKPPGSWMILVAYSGLCGEAEF